MFLLLLLLLLICCSCCCCRCYFFYQQPQIKKNFTNAFGEIAKFLYASIVEAAGSYELGVLYGSICVCVHLSRSETWVCEWRGDRLESRKNENKKTQRRWGFKELEAAVWVDRLELGFSLLALRRCGRSWRPPNVRQNMLCATACRKRAHMLFIFFVYKKNMAATTPLPLSGNRKNKYATNKSEFYLPHYNSATCYDRVHAAAGEFLHSLLQSKKFCNWRSRFRRL